MHHFQTDLNNPFIAGEQTEEHFTEGEDDHTESDTDTDGHAEADTGTFADTVVFAGKNPPGVADSQLADWIRRLHAQDVQICVDTVGEPMRQAIAEHPAIIKPNRSEL